MDGIFGAREPQFVGCKTKYSYFFDLIAKEWHGTNYHPMHRVCSLMRKLDVTHLCREELTVDQELLVEKVDLEARIDAAIEFTAIRFTFFRILDPDLSHWRDLKDEHLLGYAVVVTFRPQTGGQAKSYLFEAVLRPPTIWTGQGVGVPVSNYNVRGQRNFATVVGSLSDNVSLRLTGSFFCQQNALTHVCAHAALRTAINSAPNYTGPKITSKRINEILGKDHTTGKRVGHYGTEPKSIGLSIPQIMEVTRQSGFYPHSAQFDLNPLVEYEEFLYPLVESGMPTILGLHPERVAHVVAVVGHTLNSDRWLPDARQGYNAVPYETTYASAAAWTDHFIVSDDNLGAMVTLPTDSIRNILVPKYNAGLHAALAIGLAPQHVEIPGYIIEKSAIDVFTFLFQEQFSGAIITNRWIDYMRVVPRTIPRVCRTTLQTKADYLSAMGEATDESEKRLTPAELQFIASQIDQEEFWVTEFTLPNLYTGNKRKFGDVLCAANCTAEQLSRMEGFMRRN